MKIYKSKLFGELQEPKDFIELLNLINLYHFDELQVCIWRGQGNIDWRIDHSAYRRLTLNKKNITEQELITYEHSLLKQATHKGYRHQNGRILSDLELMALLQHHGAATRLIDFSRNVLIALWFAVSDELEKTGILIGLNTENVAGYENGDVIIKDYKKHINDIKEYTVPQTWEPPIITPRIAAQHSQFLYSGLSKSKNGSLMFENPIDRNIFIAISPELKKELAIILSGIFDIHYQTLFPDIDGFGQSNSHSIDESKMWRW
jgi:hypothetical protein